jgi:hypothetical protein
VSLPPVLSVAFPDLDQDGGAVTHPPDPRYNCVAWAAGVTHAWWWPDDPAGYWPPSVPGETTPAAVVAALGTVGYVPCGDGQPEAGYQKAAVYARGDTATHVAVQLDGRWSSKLGREWTVCHDTPEGVAGAVFGSVVAFVQRPTGQADPTTADGGA